MSIRAGIMLAATLLAIACGRNSLDDAYRRLYLTKFAIDFPATREQLENCQRNRAETCLEVFEEASSGKERVLAAGPDRGFTATLETILSSCPSPDADREELCMGALVAYFFSEPAQDARLRDVLLHADRAVLHKLLGPLPFAWYSNRPQPELWIQALEALPDEDFASNAKAKTLRAFAAPPERLLDSGVTLLP